MGTPNIIYSCILFPVLLKKKITHLVGQKICVIYAHYFLLYLNLKKTTIFIYLIGQKICIIYVTWKSIVNILVNKCYFITASLQWHNVSKYTTTNYYLF